MSQRWIEPTTLQGQHVRLEPMTREHEAGLLDAAADGELWTLWYTGVPGPHNIRDTIETALHRQREAGELPFVVRLCGGDGAIIGSTRYCNVDEGRRRLEIGYTWYARRHQRSAVNSECKLLLLRHAFETLGSIAVEFRTHWFNHASREAIARLGAKQDGVLRNHERHADGSYRDTVVFSIIDQEWPAVARHLAYRLRRHGSSQ